MKVHVKLIGFLPHQISDYDPYTGLIFDLQGGSTVKDLLKHLNIEKPGDSVVVCNGRVLQVQDRLSAHSSIKVFPIVHGG